MRHLAHLLAAALLTPLVTPAAPPPEPNVAVELRLLVRPQARPFDPASPDAPRATAGADLEITDAAQTHRIVLTPGVPTRRIHYRGPATLVLNRPAPAPEIPPVPVATAALPPETTQLLLLLFPADPAETRYHLLPVAFDSASLPDEHARVFNLGRVPLLLRAGSTDHTLAPGRSALVPLPPGGGQTYLAAATSGDSGPALVYTGALPAIAGVRRLVFLHPTPENPRTWTSFEHVERPRR